MTKYIIGISGSGGGDSGPNNLYELLKLKYTNRVIMYDTIPNNETDNINNIINIIIDIKKTQQDASFILLGYSMGGTVALMVSIYFSKQNIINQVVFLSTQTAGFNNLNLLTCPIIFIHSINDSVIPIQYLNKWIANFNGEYKLYLLSCEHDWEKVNIIKIIKILNIN